MRAKFINPGTQVFGLFFKQGVPPNARLATRAYHYSVQVLLVEFISSLGLELLIFSVLSLIAQLKNLHAHTNTHESDKWKTQNKLSSCFHFPQHNLPIIQLLWLTFNQSSWWRHERPIKFLRKGFLLRHNIIQIERKKWMMETEVQLVVSWKF